MRISSPNFSNKEKLMQKKTLFEKLEFPDKSWNRCLIVINWLIKSSLVKISSRHCLSQIVRSRKPTFWENFHPPPHDTCHMSRAMYDMWHVTCYVWHVTCYLKPIINDFFFYKVVRLVGGGSVINRAYPVKLTDPV